MKTGNLCAKCHQARTYTHTNDTYDSVNASGTATYSRFGPHYGVQTNVFTWNGLEDVSGFTSVTNQHALLAEGCVTCHMASVTNNTASGGHTFITTAALLTRSAEFNQSTPKCSTCHDSATIVKGDVAKQVKADLDKIRTFLITNKYIDTSNVTELRSEANERWHLGDYFAATNVKKGIRRDTSQVILNYLYIWRDRSNGAHNPVNIKAMIAAMKTFLGI